MAHGFTWARRGSAGRTSCSRSRARAEAPPLCSGQCIVGPQGISPITSFLACRCGSGRWRRTSGYAPSWNATPRLWMLLCACSGALWSPVAVRVLGLGNPCRWRHH